MPLGNVLYYRVRLCVCQCYTYLKCIIIQVCIFSVVRLSVFSHGGWPLAFPFLWIYLRLSLFFQRVILFIYSFILIDLQEFFIYSRN